MHCCAGQGALLGQHGVELCHQRRVALAFKFRRVADGGGQIGAGGSKHRPQAIGFCQHVGQGLGSRSQAAAVRPQVKRLHQAAPIGKAIGHHGNAQHRQGGWQFVRRHHHRSSARFLRLQGLPSRTRLRKHPWAFCARAGLCAVPLHAQAGLPHRLAICIPAHPLHLRGIPRRRSHHGHAPPQQLRKIGSRQYSGAGHRQLLNHRCAHDAKSAPRVLTGPGGTGIGSRGMSAGKVRRGPSSGHFYSYVWGNYRKLRRNYQTFHPLTCCAAFTFSSSA